ncbi:hypothetical protein HOY80DRAFT_887961, partial [Tuber brumale]
VVMSMDVLKHVSRPSSLRKAAVEHIILPGWRVLYMIQRTLTRFVRELFVAQDVLGILKGGMRDRNTHTNAGATRGIFPATEAWGDVLVI